MLSHLLLVALAATPAAAGSLDPAAFPPAPAPPQYYDVQIRYQINASGNEHIAQYLAMVRFFKDAGFVRDPDEVVPGDEPEDQRYNRMTGRIASAKVPLLLAEPHVRVLQLMPKGVKPPAEADALVRVDLQLTAGFAPERQRLLPRQVREAIADLKFREAVGYDDRGGTRLLGAIPVGQLDALLDDVRKRPGAPHLPPLQSAWPIRVVEVRPDLPRPSGRPEPPAIAKGQEKIAPELRELLADAAKAAAPARLEVILTRTPTAGELGYVGLLSLAAPGLVVEGRLGPVAAVRTTISQAPALAALPEVAEVRLPRVARPRLETADSVEGWKPLEASGVERLQVLNHKGRGTRVAIIDGDFTGWRQLTARSGDRAATMALLQLPADTRMVDLTRERNDDLESDAEPADGKPLGHGVHMALAVLRAAPEVQLTLVRIDPAAPYMFQQAARAIHGEAASSDSLRNRLANLDAASFRLDQEFQSLRDERAQVLKKFTDVSQKPVLLKKKEAGPLSLDEEVLLQEIEQREAYEKKQADWDRRNRQYHESVNRYFQLIADLQSLKGVQIVASGLVWNEGYPADGASSLTRYFDDQPFKSALWFQSAGDVRGQGWSGLFRDANQNGVMEFADVARSGDRATTGEGHEVVARSPDRATTGEVVARSPVRAIAWPRESNFLTWAPDAAQSTRDLPAGVKSRISLQWREAHDPNAGRAGEDPYLQPLANLRIVLLYQPDPNGVKQPADDFDVVAQSVGLPARLEATPSSAVYEQTVELRVTKPGRYAVRVEGTAPTSTRSPQDPSIPAERKTFELRPRLFVETLEGPGRAVLKDSTTQGAMGMPADSRAVVTVGAADHQGRPEPYSPGGTPRDGVLLLKPDVLAYDQVESRGKDAAQGAGVATGFAAGVAAASHGAGATLATGWRQSMDVEPGGVLRVPGNWPSRR